jgi:hypothetical protein
MAADVGGVSTDRPMPPVLTTLQIKSAKPAERAYKLADTGGLFVLVQPNGSKLWRYKPGWTASKVRRRLGRSPRSRWPTRGTRTQSRASWSPRAFTPSKLDAMNERVAPRRNCTESRAALARCVPTWNAATGADLRPATVLQRNREIDKDLTPRF